MEWAEGPSHANEVSISFGDYLTNQYELLMRTLSFLNIDDLSRAAYVCKSWNVVVNHIYRKRDENNKFRWHTRPVTLSSAPKTCFDGEIYFRSSSVIGFELPQYKHFLWKDLLIPKFLLSKPADDDDDTDYVIPGVLGDIFSVVTDFVIAPINDRMMIHDCTQAAAVFFPKTDGFDLRTMLINNRVCLGSVCQTLLQKNQQIPLKGLLFFDNGEDQEKNIEQVIFNTLRQSIPAQTFPIGGGIFKRIEKFEGTEWICNMNAVLFAFYGNKVECYADVLQGQCKENIKEFIINMRKNLPPVDKSKQQRIAFIFRCVARKYGQEETNVFVKYFPDTPFFLMLSYGEFGFRSNTGNYKAKKRLKMSEAGISFAFSSVYFIVTIDLL